MLAKHLKATEREVKRHKARHGPRGGTVAGQAARTRTARGYRGSAKQFIRKRGSGPPVVG